MSPNPKKTRPIQCRNIQCSRSTRCASGNASRQIQQTLPQTSRKRVCSTSAHTVWEPNAAQQCHPKSHTLLQTPFRQLSSESNSRRSKKTQTYPKIATKKRKQPSSRPGSHPAPATSREASLRSSQAPSRRPRIFRMLRTGARFSSRFSGCSAREHDFERNNEEILRMFPREHDFL